MSFLSPAYELIYVSSISPDAVISAVPDISRQSRRSNPLNQITGLLVFDGQRFCQQMEGAIGKVMELFERIEADPRHGDVCLLHQGPLASRRFREFNIGYPLDEAGDALLKMVDLHGERAVDAFARLRLTVHVG